MTFSSRRSLTPSSACRGLVTEGMGIDHKYVDSFTTCLHVMLIKERCSGEGTRTCGSH